MFGNDVLLYFRENQLLIMGMVAGSVAVCLLIILIQVMRTRREVHNICKKIHRYFDVILAETDKDDAADEAEKAPQKLSASQMPDAKKKQAKEEDVQLLMDVISNVF
ncbi:MAG: hypothetical protein J6A75_12530 [Lachnospiraceae bacterium]|nr:hypothetical protein [Lachnospiraceae bacterium]